jgi:methanogenic corrinoid protein MtbC1
MASEERTKEIINEIRQALINYDEDGVGEWAKKLRPAIKASGRQSEAKGSIVLGVVEGDVHDIGKNLIKMMFDVAGWTVYDLGKDVPLDKFVEEQLRTDSEIVGLSALMTTSMVAMQDIVKKLKEKNPNVRIMLGGAPITQEITDMYGADGYAESAGTAVDEAMKLIKMLKEEEMERK